MKTKVNPQNPIRKGVTYDLSEKEMNLINKFARSEYQLLTYLKNKYKKPANLSDAQWVIWLKSFIK